MMFKRLVVCLNTELRCNMCINPCMPASRDFQPVPCGKCMECKKRLIHSWAFRIAQEEKRAITSHFLTLTYDTENVPVTQRGYFSLWKRDVQLYFKRLRKAHTKSGQISPIKYFLCGEYGGSSKRPHYHIILFNAELADIEAAWQLGSIYYGTVTIPSIYYTCKYMMKTQPKFKKGDRQPEFRLMSKGLGELYTTNKKNQSWHKADIENRLYLNLTDGKKIAMPRYYKDKMFTEEEREIAAYAGLLKAKKLAEKDKLNPEQKHERILTSWLAIQFEAKSRHKV